IGNTNQLILQILPLKTGADKLLAKQPNTDINTLIDDKASITPMTYRGVLILSNNTEGSSMEPLYPNQKGHEILTTVQEQYRKQLAMQAALSKKMSLPSHLAKDQNLTVMDSRKSSLLTSLNSNFA